MSGPLSCCYASPTPIPRAAAGAERTPRELALAPRIVVERGLDRGLSLEGDGDGLIEREHPADHSLGRRDGRRLSERHGREAGDEEQDEKRDSQDCHLDPPWSNSADRHESHAVTTCDRSH